MKNIEGYEGRYKITEDGKVYSLLSGRYLKPTIRNKQETRPKDRQNDYYAIGLYGKDKKFRLHSIHRLVALAYIPNPDNLPEVNHRDGNKLNNKVDNLEWSTRKKNAEHSVKLGLQTFKGKRFTEGEVLYIRENPDNKTNGELAKQFGVRTNTIWSIKNYKTYKYY